MSYPPQIPQPYPPIQPPILLPIPEIKHRRYSLFGAMIRAPFFSGNVYRDVARNWTGIGFWHLFLLLLITWIAVLVKLHIAMGAFTRNDFPGLVRDVPPITIDKGHVTSPVTQPYTINDPETGRTFAVLDTTGVINTLDDTDATILITDHKIWARQQDNNQVRGYDLSKVQYFFVDKARMTGWMNTLSHVAAVGALPFVLVFSLIARLLQVLIYGAINLALGAMFNAPISFAAAMRLATVSITPILLIDTILWLTGKTVPYWPLLGILISLLYLVTAVRANRVKLPI